jgi:hypothetical protein
VRSATIGELQDLVTIVVGRTLRDTWLPLFDVMFSAREVINEFWDCPTQCVNSSLPNAFELVNYAMLLVEHGHADRGYAVFHDLLTFHPLSDRLRHALLVTGYRHYGFDDLPGLTEDIKHPCYHHWHFPEEDFPLWLRHFGSQISPRFIPCTYSEYLEDAASRARQCAATGSRYVPVTVRVQHMLDELASRGCENNSRNWTAILDGFAAQHGAMPTTSRSSLCVAETECSTRKRTVALAIVGKS